MLYLLMGWISSKSGPHARIWSNYHDYHDSPGIRCIGDFEARLMSILAQKAIQALPECLYFGLHAFTLFKQVYYYSYSRPFQVQFPA